MTEQTVPRIFSRDRKARRLDRSISYIETGAPTRFLLDEMQADVIERLAFLRFEPERILLDRMGFSFAPLLERGAGFFFTPADYDQPFAPVPGGIDLVASLASLDTVNDLPGALIHMRELARPDGLLIASFVGGASLHKLRRAMIEAEPERSAPRMHPLIDPRSCPGLLQRAGWRKPVVDTVTMTARYSTLDRLVHDLREQALGNALATPAPPLTKASANRARAAFLAQADEDGKVSETFEIITLTGWR